MNAAGVIVEYNPFHNGHLYHVQETKKSTGADVIVAVMSGNFLQRGEPAIVSKQARTNMALLGGCDLVIELPYAFATQHAEIFASGAISLLEALKVREVCFGSEDGNIDHFYHTVEHLKENESAYNYYIHEAMQGGVSYPMAATIAFNKINDKHDKKLINLSKPNNILGYHYIKAIIDQNCYLKAKTILRTKANYHDESFTSENIASATSIRKSIHSSKSIRSIKSYVPEITYAILDQYFHEFKALHDWELYFPLLKYRILTMSTDELGEIYEVEEGIEHRISKHIKGAQTFDELMKRIKTKRYTWTRLQRMFLHILTNTKKIEMKNILKTKKASYIRLLGMSKQGRSYLTEMKKKIELPLISKVSAYTSPLFSLDLKAVNCYSSILDEPYRTKLIQNEFSIPPIRFEDNDNEASIG